MTHALALGVVRYAGAFREPAGSMPTLLTRARVTSSGWGGGTDGTFPDAEGVVEYRWNGTWYAVSWGTSPGVRDAPRALLKAIGW
jgi:hypothetical protein